jgi:3'-5' exoribonuclease
MALKSLFIVPLCELVDGQEADVFVLLSAKEQLKTRDGRPYFRVTFRDARREVSFPIWEDGTWAKACRDDWQPGEFYKIRCLFRATEYGPQLDIKKIRPIEPQDRSDGFSELMCQPASRYDPVEVFNELVAIAQEHIADEPLRRLVVGILADNREALLTLPAATHNHHAFVGGWLEHVRSVVQTVIYLVAKYQKYYDDLRPPLSKDVAIAGAILHDIGKLRELQLQPQGAAFSVTGELIGHVLQGRDSVREAAARTPLNAETQLRLEHLIVAHQRLPEWGSPKPPMTPEALIVHYADDLDAKLHMFYTVLRDEQGDGPLTSGKNALRQKIYRGESR